MDEEKSTVTNEQANEKKEIKLTLSQSMIGSLFAIAALILFAFYKILANFGVYHRVFHGIMSIVIFGLALCGLIFSLIKDKKFNFVSCLNMVTAIAVIIFF